MKTIVIANQKGGVGKTTTAVTLAHGLAIAGQRTLLGELDPQGHVAFALSAEKAPGLYRLIVDEEPIEKVAVFARENLDIIPGDKRTEKAKRTVVISNFPTGILSHIFEDAQYDVVIFDMAPSLDMLHVSALMAVDGVNEVLRSMAEVVERGHRLGYSTAKPVPTFFDCTTRETIVQLQALVDTFQEHVWPAHPAGYPRARLRHTARACGNTAPNPRLSRAMVRTWMPAIPAH